VRLTGNCHPCVSPCTADTINLGHCLSSTKVKETELAVENHQALSIREVPDTKICHEEQSACCSKEETCHEACEKACKFRHFAIKGDICVSEKVTYKENGIEDSESEGWADKNTVAVDKLDAGEIDDEKKCYCAKVCAPIDLEPCGCSRD